MGGGGGGGAAVNYLAGLPTALKQEVCWSLIMIFCLLYRRFWLLMMF